MLVVDPLTVANPQVVVSLAYIILRDYTQKKLKTKKGDTDSERESGTTYSTFSVTTRTNMQCACPSKAKENYQCSLLGFHV